MLGAFNGLALSIFLFVSKKVKSIAALFLGILLLAISIRVTVSVFLYFNFNLPKIYPQIGHSACFLIDPSLYYFSKATLRQVTQIPASWKWGWGIQLGITLLVGMLFPFKTYPNTWSSWGSYICYGQWAAYVVATGFLFKPVIKAFFAKTPKLGGAEKFWLLIYGSTSLILLVYLITISGIICLICISGPISFSFVLYLTLLLYGTNLENILTPGEGGRWLNLKKRKIAGHDAKAWIAKLERSILDNELYRNPHLKLSNLAQSINISSHQLSQLLNDNLGKSFSTYINEFRIQEACKLISTNERLTFEAIGYEVGYNSKSTFYSAFKKVTDTTPALFKEGLENNKL
ncbi:helix-turn-helix domain-containing protein [Paraflavitalea speifideaquila]|uniref:helix-turn-helix domain-containing protein n=1 Tax=Paraflavitalea speifideaquila TaxID=3076558 RepID=UPI0028EFB012|nr:helix-turn-helix domain-containing protein [Paraflavitalea speifideiaquila]